MTNRFPHASHLLNDEVDYELKLRNYKEDLSKDLESKHRLLRRLFYKDAKEKRQYRSPYSIDQEFDLISSRVDSIRTGLARKADPKLISRLRHYGMRAARSETTDENSQQLKNKLLKCIYDLLGEQGAMADALPEDTLEEDSSEKEVTETEKDEGKKKSKSDSLTFQDKQNALSNGKPRNELEGAVGNVEEAESKEQLERTIVNLQYQLQELGSKFNQLMITNQRNQERYENAMSQLGQQNHNQSVLLNTRNQSSRNFEISEDSSDGATRREQDRVIGPLRGRNSSDRRNRERQSHRDDREQYDRRIEKWNLSFSGDVRTTTLEDFMYKAKVLASMNGIARDKLLNHIHLLLRGDASNWFFTYYDATWNWDEFETQIRFRFGNPNQDQGNRQKIVERKQQKGETFIAFTTEIERLNKLLTKPLSSRRKFEIIWENMRPHYRSKLACFSVNSLEELIQMNYRIDANDPSLHPLGPKYAINNIDDEVDDSDNTAGRDINMVERSYNNASRAKERISRVEYDENRREKTRLPLCWNCRQHGHFWRSCKERKTIFCYICGNPGTTSATCDSHPRRRPVPRTAETQNSEN